MKIWIVKKHPPHPFSAYRGFLEAFTIHSTHATKAEAAEEAKARNKKSIYHYSTGHVELKDSTK